MSALSFVTRQIRFEVDEVRTDIRLDIDGLRSVSVALVIAFHLGFSWFPGGIVGVDVFFVISGFLITHQILRAISSGDFFLGDFYVRGSGDCYRHTLLWLP